MNHSAKRPDQAEGPPPRGDDVPSRATQDKLQRMIATMLAGDTRAEAGRRVGMSPKTTANLCKRWEKWWTTEYKTIRARWISEGRPVADDAEACKIKAPAIPPEKTREIIRQIIAAMLSNGGTIKDAGAKLGLSEKATYSMHDRWRQYWITEYENTRAQWTAQGRAIAPTPRQEIQEGIRKATALAAAGSTEEEIAKALGVQLGTLQAWKDTYRALWQQEKGRSLQALVIMVRSQAGTEAVTDDPEGHIRRARSCEKWLRGSGRELFTIGERPTLRTFYDDWFKKVRLADSPQKTVLSYEGVVRNWVLLTGDPPLEEITELTLAIFKKCLAKLPGKNRVSPLSPNTIRSNLRHLQTLLDKAGPKGPRNRDAAGILKNLPPWIKPPRAVYKEPRFVPLEYFNQVYLATACMDLPHVPGIKPPAWWKALLAVAYNTQARYGTLFTMRMDEINWQKECLDLPAERFKNRRAQRIHLNAVALRHLQAIRTNRELVFPGFGSSNSYYRALHRLLKLAAIPDAQHFGLHDIRRTGATLLWDDSPQAAQLALGHQSPETTRRHYIHQTGIVARALDALPQPEAFNGGT